MMWPMRSLALALLVSLSAACIKDKSVETMPPELLEDETLSEEERKKAAAKKREKEAAEAASKPAAPAPAEVTPPDDVAGPPDGAKKTAQGVFYVILRPGKGKVKPKEKSTVKVHYSGWTTNGKLFDSSVKRGEPAEFPVGALIPGWVEVLQMMVAGDKWRIWIPEELAYKGRAGAPQGMLVFDMELIEIVSL